MPDINMLSNGSTIPVQSLATSLGKSAAVDASASKAAYMCQVYAEGSGISQKECVVVSGLTSCVGLILQCSGGWAVACHFNGGHDASSEWAKVAKAVGGTTVQTAIIILNSSASASDKSLMEDGVRGLDAEKVLYYTPSSMAVPIALFGDGTFGELTTTSTGAKSSCCIIL